MSISFWKIFGPFVFINVTVLSLFVFFMLTSSRRKKTIEIENRNATAILGRQVREFWWWLTGPIFRLFIHFKIRPNAISILGAVIAGISGIAFGFNHVGLGGWLMVIGASCDFFDGRVARETNRMTLAGSFIDASLDRVGEGMTLTGIAWLYRDSLMFFVVMAVYLGSVVTSYSKARGESMGVFFTGGLMQRPERMAYLGAGSILTPMFAYLAKQYLSCCADINFWQLQLMIYCIPLAIVAVLSNVTAVHRMVRIMQMLDEKQFGKSLVE